MPRLPSDQLIESRRFGLRDLAKVSGYSCYTVWKVMNGHGGVLPKTRQAILEVAEKHQYRPNAAARSILQNKTFHVGVMVRNAPDAPFHNPFMMEMIVGLNARLAEKGYVLSLIRIGDVAESMSSASRVFREHTLDGMVISGDIPDDICQAVKQLMPCSLFVDCNVWQPHGCLQHDEYSAGYTITSHLIAQGYRKLVWVGPDPSVYRHYSGIRRYSGVQAAAIEAGIEIKGFFRRMVQKSGEHHQMVPDEVVRAYCQPDTAIVCYSSNDALEWYMLARRYGWDAPKDYGLASCEDTRSVADSWPGLTRIAVNRLEMGTQAGSMFLQLLEDPEHPPASQMMRGLWVPGETIRQVFP